MHKIWNYISNLGITSDKSQMNQRTIILSNQLNFLMLITSVFLFIYSVSVHRLNNTDWTFGTYRNIVLFVVNCLIILLARFGFTQLSRLALIYMPVIVFILGPTMSGYIMEESYVYYPYIIICTSVIAQLLLNPREEKFHFWFAWSYYFALTIFIYWIMVEFTTDNFGIVDRIKNFWEFYIIAPIVIFLAINGSIYYLRKINFDFEELLNRKNEELEVQNVELKKQKDQIEEQKDELVGKEISTWQKLVKIMTHEIVNSAIPITNLAGMSSQMLENESGEILKPEMIGEDVTVDIHHSLKIIESRTQGLIKFVKATKSLTNIQQPSIRKIFIRELCERIGILYQAKFKEAGVQFETEIIPPDLHIEADLEMIEQVIINLIQNALEAIQETSQPKISFIARKNESGHVQILLSDNGAGISDEVKERIFLPYYSTKPNNSGIGLSLSQQIMMLHHGRLEVISEPNKGATFNMIFEKPK
jgi:signal transduction histidine kinase